MDTRENPEIWLQIATELASASVSSWVEMAKRAREGVSASAHAFAHEVIYFGARAAEIDGVFMPHDMIEAVYLVKSAGDLMISVMSDIFELNLQYKFHELDRDRPPSILAQRLAKKIGFDFKTAPELDHLFSRVERYFIMCKAFDAEKGESGVMKFNIEGATASIFCPKASTALQLIQEYISGDALNEPGDEPIKIEPKLIEAITMLAEQPLPPKEGQGAPIYPRPSSIN